MFANMVGLGKFVAFCYFAVIIARDAKEPIMKYMSLDIETGGLDHQCDMLTFCGIIDDLKNPKPIEELPVLNCIFIKPKLECGGNPIYQGQPSALSMHQKVFERISVAMHKKITKDEDGTLFITVDQLPNAINDFLFKNGWTPSVDNDLFYIPVAGKNIGTFDIPFMKNKIKKWGRIKFLQRALDPAILYLNPLTDKNPPDLEECMSRAGLQKAVSHVAKDDAIMVIQLLRNYFLGHAIQA